MSTYARILRFIRPYRLALALSVVCSILFSIFSGMSIYLIMPLLQMLFTGGAAVAPAAAPGGTIMPDWLMRAKEAAGEAFRHIVFRPEPADSLLVICLIIVSSFFLKNLFAYIQSNLMIYVEQGLTRDLRNALYRHIHELPLAYFTNERTGNLISRIMNDIPVINTGISATFQTMVREPLLLIVYLTICLVLSWKLTLIAFVVFPAVLLVIALVGRRVHRESGLAQERIADLTSTLHETISGVKVVKAFSMEEFENRKFARESHGYFRTILHVTNVRNLASPMTEFLSAAAGGVIIWYGGLQVLGHAMDSSEFILFLFAMFQLMPPVKELSNVNNRIQEASAAGDRVFEVLDTEPNIRDAADAVALPSFERELRFDNVSFRYGEGDTVLDGISLTIRKGEVVAVVGPSGAGKSTLIDLVPRFYDPTAGRILIDGIDLRRVRLRSLREKIGIVTQETILFNDTVRNNIAYGLEDCPLASIVEAAKAANAHSFISEMPFGYDSVIGERCVKLSGGERQRLALARAILKNPPVLILDEATSALDTESEILVQEAIERLMTGRTSIVIAHRLSTIQHADRIVVIEGGKVVEAGKHSELIGKTRGLYRKLYQLQFRA